MPTLITGGAGFIGSHLVDYLLSETATDVIVLDDFSTGRTENLTRFEDHDRVDIRRGDIRDENVVQSAIDDSETVYHLAAAVGVERIVDNPLDSLKTNLIGTENVLEATARNGIPTFVASSSEVYGKSSNVPFSEDTDRVIGPSTTTRWGYASAKATDEFLSLAYHKEQDLPVVVGRFFNIVGPRQSGQYGMVIPTFVEQAIANKPLTVYGDGTQTRSFTHVHDAVEVIYELMNQKSAYGDVFNVGAPNPTSINDLAQRVLELSGSDSEIIHVPFEEVYGPGFEEPDEREPDVTKLRELIGWAPESDLDRILKDVIDERSNVEAVVNV